MRGLVQASGLKKVQRQLGVSPTSLGSFSEAASVFDAEQLKPLSHDSRLDDLPGSACGGLAVDGSELTALAKLTDRMIDGREVKLHAHFEPLTGVPRDIDLTAAKDSEVDNLRQRLLPNRVYVKDRVMPVSNCCRIFTRSIRTSSAACATTAPTR